MSSKEIGAVLGISPKTVDKRIDAARRKHGCADRNALARALQGAQGRENPPPEFLPLAMPSPPGHQYPGHCADPAIFTLSEAGFAPQAWGQPGWERFLEGADQRWGPAWIVVAILGGAMAIAAFLLVVVSVARELSRLV